PLRRGVLLEELEAIDEVHAADRVAADPDAGALSQAAQRRLVHGLVRERARARHDPDRARLVDRARHDADLALTRSDDAGAVRADQASAAAAQDRLHLYPVELRPALRAAADELMTRVRGLDDRHRRHRPRPVAP